jgi:hypothetical protein
VDVNGEKVALDATDPCLEIGLLRPICLNNRGLKITPRFEEWVELEEKRFAKAKVITLASVKENSLVATIKVSKLNYFAYKDCSHFDSFEEVVDVDPGLIISNVEMSGKDSLTIGNRIVFECNADSLVDKSGSLWSFQPFWIERIKKSPFEAKKRKFPITFPYLIEINWNFSLKMDESISINSIPKNEEITTPDNTMRFIYDVKVLDSVVQINAQFSILKRRYAPENYDDILEFYKNMEKKLKEELKIKVKK